MSSSKSAHKQVVILTTFVRSGINQQNLVRGDFRTQILVKLGMICEGPNSDLGGLSDIITGLLIDLLHVWSDFLDLQEMWILNPFGEPNQ